MNLFKRPYLLLSGLFFVLAYLLPLGVRPLFIPDETRYAEIAREMIARSDWVVPHLNGLKYFEKPILGYWVHALAQLLLGETNFAVRIPSALAIGLTALLLIRLCRLPSRISAGDSLGAMAALIFLSCMTVFGIGTFAVLDNLLTLFLSLCLAAFFLATEAEPRSREEKIWLIVAGVGCGLAFLTKGFLALAVPVLVAGPYLVWQRRLRDVWRMPWLPLLAAVIVSLPWAVMIQLRAPDFWNFFFWHEHVRRFFSGHADHAKPAWFFVALLPVMTLPWSFLLGSFWQGARTRSETPPRETALLRYALCWLVFPLLFFSASSGKLITYILPCFPALALLAAICIDRYLASGKTRSFNVGDRLAAGFFGLLLIAVIVIQQVGFRGEPPFSRLFPWVGGSLALAVTVLCFLGAWRVVPRSRKLLLYALAPLPFYCFAPNLMPDQTLAAKAPDAFLTELRPQIAADDLVVTESGLVRAVAWGLKRDDLYLFPSKGELSYGLDLPEGQGRILNDQQLSRLIAEHPGKVVFIAKAKHYREWANRLPQPSRRLKNHPHGVIYLRY